MKQCLGSKVSFSCSTNEGLKLGSFLFLQFFVDFHFYFGFIEILEELEVFN